MYMLRFIYSGGVKLQLAIEWIIDHFYAYFIKHSMGACGRNVMIKPSTSVFKGLENFYICDDVRIARYAVIYSTRAKVYIGHKVEIAPYLKIITGNHNVKNIGHFMFDGDINKNKDDDRDVIIEGDSWFGINVTILAGVTIGRGSVIAAGAIVTKSCPPYSIIGGVPARVLKFRFSIDEVLEHERGLYPQNERYTREELELQREQYMDN